ncbi:MAG: exodeoxyribonuclease VII small subunit [Lachnospiraceae bacterium]|nr:exodeoxyribonuclease VII small subunit [Lachnospiraceae bacterium]MBQ6639183.1 exodeoxyribonuclease VII small subunit [Lachnospiraceae bacterium]
MEETNKTTLEEDFKKLESLLKEMEREDIGIEDAFAKYAEGMQLIKTCNEKIDRVEKKVMQLSDDLKLTPLDENGTSGEE